MNEDEHQEKQIKFVESLAQEIVQKIKHDILTGKVPPDWDGTDLRQLLALRAKRSADWVSPKRRRSFLNTVNVRDL